MFTTIVHAHFEKTLNSLQFPTHLHDKFQKFKLFWLTGTSIIENWFELLNYSNLFCSSKARVTFTRVKLMFFTNLFLGNNCKATTQDN